MTSNTGTNIEGGRKTAWGQTVKELPWGLWWRQVAAIMRLDVKRALLSRSALGVTVLAALPVVLSLLIAIFLPERAARRLGGLEVYFAIIFRTFMLRFVIFFGCMSIFTGLFRAEVLEKTLHYYFLAPIRREVLAAGKYAAGLVTAFLIFATSTTVSFMAIHFTAGSRAGQDFLLTGPGIGRLAAYLAVTALACLGYGSVFLLTGLIFRNPIIPAAFLLGWESINLFLPPVLKQISVIFYLESLCPVSIPTGPVTILADPAPAWLSVPGLVILTSLVLILAGYKLKNMEISYSSD